MEIPAYKYIQKVPSHNIEGQSFTQGEGRLIQGHCHLITNTSVAHPPENTSVPRGATPNPPSRVTAPISTVARSPSPSPIQGKIIANNKKKTFLKICSKK